jgi:predicted DCC family thiol-disulfide oxidoreductase YuxK
MTGVPESFPGIHVSGFHPGGELLWDGECGFCAASTAWLVRFARKPIAVKPFQQARHLLPEEVWQTTRHQMLWVGRDGTIVGGSLALIAVLRAAGHPILAWAGGNALARPFTRLAYRLVARSRGSLGRSCVPKLGA